MTLKSYSKPLSLGHKFLDGLMDGIVVIQEKIDGSQFSFSVQEDELSGEVTLVCQSRRQKIDLCNPGMFDWAVQTAVRLFESRMLVPGWTYRGEYLRKPKHNTLAYDRVPCGHVILFDIDKDDQDYMSPGELDATAEFLGLEAVPTLLWVEGPVYTETLENLLLHTSILGSQKIESVVIKNYGRIGPDSKVLMGKLVSTAFREAHSDDWKKRNPNRRDIVDQIIRDYGSEARWCKAVQHLAEQGVLVNAPQDIGKLMKEIGEDFEAELAEEIGQCLWRHFRKDILRGIQIGFPEWYKARVQG